MEMYETSSNVFELYASFLEIKRNLDLMKIGTNYGDFGADGTLEAGGDNIVIPVDGAYHVVLDLNALT